MPTRAVWLISAVLVFCSGVDAASFAQNSSADSSILAAASWSGSVFSHRAGGYLCWLGDREGALRLEVVETPGESGAVAAVRDADPLDMLDPLLTRTGNGWTLILGPEGTGTLNAWDREWRKVPQGLAQVVRLVTVVLQEHPRRPRFDFAVAAGPRSGWTGIPRPVFAGSAFPADQGEGSWRYQLPPLELDAAEQASATDFRSRLTSRGRGTGGAGEVVSLDWIPSADGERRALVVTSSRRPGTLRLGPVRRMAVKSPEPEVFLPLWPLSQFLESR